MSRNFVIDGPALEHALAKMNHAHNKLVDVVNKNGQELRKATDVINRHTARIAQLEQELAQVKAALRSEVHGRQYRFTGRAS